MSFSTIDFSLTAFILKLWHLSFAEYPQIELMISSFWMYNLFLQLRNDWAVFEFGATPQGVEFWHGVIAAAKTLKNSKLITLNLQTYQSLRSDWAIIYATMINHYYFVIYVWLCVLLWSGKSCLIICWVDRRSNIIRPYISLSLLCQ